jgi:hypothetical protein
MRSLIYKLTGLPPLAVLFPEFSYYLDLLIKGEYPIWYTP